MKKLEFIDILSSISPEMKSKILNKIIGNNENFRNILIKILLDEEFISENKNNLSLKICNMSDLKSQFINILSTNISPKIRWSCRDISIKQAGKIVFNLTLQLEQLKLTNRNFDIDQFYDQWIIVARLKGLRDLVGRLEREKIKFIYKNYCNKKGGQNEI